MADAFAPMPMLIAATRSASGTARMLLSAVADSLLFGVLHTHRAGGAP